MMPNNSWNKFIKNAKEKYYEIESVPCPAFGGEKIYFTRNGFKHLIYKNRKFRSKKEQFRKIKLFPQAVKIINHGKVFSESRVFEIQTKTSIKPVTIRLLWINKAKIPLKGLLPSSPPAYADRVT